MRRLFSQHPQLITLIAAAIVLALVLPTMWLLDTNLTQAVTVAERSTPTPTYPPVPELMQTLDELLQIDAECLSPCWWGYVLGEASPDEWHDFLESKFGQVESYVRGESGERIVEVELSDKQLVYATAAQIRLLGEYREITEIFISYQPVRGPSGYNKYPMGYGLPTVITAYGIPTQILVATALDSPTLHLIYENYNFMVRYVFRPSVYPPYEANWDEHKVWICPKIETLFFLNIQAFALNQPATFAFIEGNEDLFPIAEISEFDPATFAEGILEDPEFCFDVPLQALP